MAPAPLQWFLLAAPSLLSGVAVLTFAGVGRGVWLMHLTAASLSIGVAAAGGRMLRHVRGRHLAQALLVLTVAGVAWTLAGSGAGPHRWVRIGALNLYAAPMLLPSFLAAMFGGNLQPESPFTRASWATIGVALLLAAQPDASQVLALLAAACIGFWRSRTTLPEAATTVCALGLTAAWALGRPDPLEPVPYVEGVFTLALQHSALAGVAVIASAGMLVAGLAACSRRGASWLLPVAVYYAALFVCAALGKTPAPLIGYGAGPMVGFGLLAAVSRGLPLAP